MPLKLNPGHIFWHCGKPKFTREANRKTKSPQNDPGDAKNDSSETLGAPRTFQDPKLSQELKPTPIQKPTRQPAPRLRQGPAAKVGACRSAASLKHAAERFRFPLLSFQWILRKIPHHPAHHFRRPLAAGHLRKLVWKRNRNQNARNGN